MLVFLATAVLRSALTKQDLVAAKLLTPESLTVEEKRMPEATPCPPLCARFCGRTKGHIIGSCNCLRAPLACVRRVRAR